MAPSCHGKPPYLRSAVFSYGHLLGLCALLGSAVFIACGWGGLTALLAVAMVLVLDATCVGTASRLTVFRRTVDRRIAETARAAAADLRAALLQRMATAHQQELVRLESLVDAMADRFRARTIPVRPPLDACGDLLATYVRLAIRYHEGELSLSLVERARLDDEISTLERMPCPDSIRPHLQRRIAVCRQRAKLWDSTRERLGMLHEQLRMIGDRIRLAFEDLTGPSMSSEEHWRIAFLDDQEMELVRVEDEIDPQILALGRAPPLQRVAAWKRSGGSE